ncbi:MAG TPA: pyrroline-5-carboxylate reductase [Spirochaetota bacterium]|nr:pyrroline-5-carboxylate reductase [Spirochaetota bacterium]HPC42249.1 pyrroline-5-carboxylate reductase [Spirochaetota bacterium]HPL18841.1 pyrroline-5-carboxylate reductase [Spirochaetota bacterium]HQF09954.1 pyrroline-5-carboxylate reductase [Spirochaetota bacterium]HQH98659.1 pyrroline-5-carboxylate reductase [Spirochaetota bacterium]
MKAVNKKIGCIGAGNMGGAILSRLAAGADPSAISVYDITPGKADALAHGTGITVAKSPEDCARASDILIVAVKPDAVAAALNSIKGAVAPGAVIVSIAAGVTIAAMEEVLGRSMKIVRVMPNTPAMVGEGMSVLAPNGAVDDNSLLDVERIFSRIGRVLVLPEKLMDAVTGLSGSGPAYVFTFIQALADGGVKLGIPREKALVLAAQTVMGSAKYLLESGEDPMALRGKVTSPGGTTIEGIHVLERSGFSGIVMDAVEKAAQKSQKLGEK